jgi:aminoglycoside/choline kinase family phosphotransferase
MVVRDGAGQLGLGWIDFQDAMLGPRIYDMVALLSDSYQTFSREFVQARLEDFARFLELSPGERTLLEREFQLVTVQRKLKDAGRFIFIERTHQNPAFLPFVAGSIQKAQAALDELQGDPILSELSRLLERLFPRSS